MDSIYALIYSFISTISHLLNPLRKHSPIYCLFFSSVFPFYGVFINTSFNFFFIRINFLYSDSSWSVDPRLPSTWLTAPLSAESSAVCASFLSIHLLVWWCPAQLQQRRKCMLPTSTNSFYVIIFSLKFQSHISNLILIFLFFTSTSFFILFSYVSFYVSTKSTNASHNILFFFTFPLFLLIFFFFFFFQLLS